MCFSPQQCSNLCPSPFLVIIACQLSMEREKNTKNPKIPSSPSSSSHQIYSSDPLITHLLLPHLSSSPLLSSPLFSSSHDPSPSSSSPLLSSSHDPSPSSSSPLLSSSHDPSPSFSSPLLSSPPLITHPEVYTRKSSPWKILVALLVGVVFGAFVASFVLFLRSKVVKRQPITPLEYPELDDQIGSKRRLYLMKSKL